MKIDNESRLTYHNVSDEKDGYLALKYLRDDKFENYTKNFIVSSQDLRDAGKSRYSNISNEIIDQVKEYYCGKCNKKLKSNSCSLLCEGKCNKWFCLNCARISRKDLNTNNKKSWSCSSCSIRNQEYRSAENKELIEQFSNLNIFQEDKDVKSPNLPKIFGINKTGKCDTLCIDCGKYFKNSNGLKIHHFRMHRQCSSKSMSSQLVSSQPVSSQPMSNQHMPSQATCYPTLPTPMNATPGNKCPVCGKIYISVRIHISKAHPDHHRLLIAESYTTGLEDDSSEHGSVCQDEAHTPEMCVYQDLVDKWKQVFSKTMNDKEFDENVSDFQHLLAESIKYLPGPKHPATKYYEKRKEKLLKASNNGQYKNSSNPERRSKRDKERRKEKFIYETIQFNYYNRRRVAVRKIMANNSTECKISLEDLAQEFSSILYTK